MPLFASYCVAEKTARAEYRHIQVLGLVPLLLGVMLALSSRTGPGPGHVAILGLAGGLELLLWGAYNLHFERDPGTGWSRRLVAASDRWFPVALFAIRSLLYMLLFAALWFTIIDLGFPSSFLLHAMFFAMLLLWPLHGVARESVRSDRTQRHELLEALARFALTVLVTLFVAAGLTRFMLPPDQPLTGDAPPGPVFVWVVAVLVILFCAILLADRVVKYRREQGPPPKEEPPPDY
ncbi:MAG: hypothetical protein JXB04_08645 [Kiritimatiellae bacterium]|nr:hypothetical protein [Kiritimatiellia bacterium]